MLEAGAEMAAEQFELPVFVSAQKINKADFADVSLQENENAVTVSGDGFSVAFDKKAGVMTSYKKGETEMLLSGPVPNFWRAPTDNDLGNNMQEWAKIWQDATYNYSSNLSLKPTKSNDGVTYKVNYLLPNNEAKVEVKYTLKTDGSLNVHFSFTPNQKDLPNIPRLGIYMTLSNDFTDVSWYGKGETESYWDRKTGVKTGVYSGKIVDQFERYLRPQETGNKTDVRWVEVTSPNVKLTASSTILLNTSVWPFDMTEIDFNRDDASESASGLVPVTKKHGADIKIGNTVQWNIDYMQMGVGGDTSWGRLVHPEYTIPANKGYEYSFTIQPN